jgi:hypothetical protein
MESACSRGRRVLVTYVCAWPGIQYRTEGVNFHLGRNRSEILRLFFAMGKIQGTPRMGSHISVHRATTKFFSNSFVFKNEIEKEGLPRGSSAGLGARILTPTTLSVTSNYERFQQIGESAFRSKLTPMA